MNDYDLKELLDIIEGTKRIKKIEIGEFKVELIEPPIVIKKKELTVAEDTKKADPDKEKYLDPSTHQEEWT